MAESSVQPKKKGIPCLGWPVIGIVILGIALFFMCSCNNTDETYFINTADTNAMLGATSPTVINDWGSLDQNAPAASYNEVTDKSIYIRGNDNYGIYDLGNDI